MDSMSFYLTSLESDIFAEVRRCHVSDHRTLSNGKAALLVQLDPPVIGQYFNEGRDLSDFVLVSRVLTQSLDHIRRFPCSVHIALLQDGAPAVPMIDPQDLSVVAWGDLYQSREDAQAHRF